MERTICRPMRDGDAVRPEVMEEILPRVRASVMNEEPVLVHCAAGHSRSASVAYGLLRVGWKLPHKEARRRVLTSRGVAGGWPLPETFDSVRAWVDERSPRGFGGEVRSLVVPKRRPRSR